MTEAKDESGEQPDTDTTAEPTTELPRAFTIRASGPATVRRKASDNLTETEDVDVTIDRQTKDADVLAFFHYLRDLSKWKRNAVDFLLDDEDTATTYTITDEDLDDWDVTFDGDIQAWFGVARQMAQGDFHLEDTELNRSDLADINQKMAKDRTRNDRAFWVSKMTRPLTDTAEYVDLYGEGVVLAYLAAEHAIGNDVSGDVQRLTDRLGVDDV